MFAKPETDLLHELKDVQYYINDNIGGGVPADGAVHHPGFLNPYLV